MKEQVLFIAIGGLLGYLGAIIQHKLESNRQRASDIRQEKLKIYSDVLSQLGGLFIEPEKLQVNLKNPLYTHNFSNRLGRILAPARLVASDKLEKKIRDMYSEELAWHEYMVKTVTEEIDEKWMLLANAATKARMEVESEMREELKK